MRIMMMTGTWPPERCGVGDYAARLADHLEGAAEVIRYGRGGSYTRRPLRRVLADVAAAAPDVIHVQYPAVGYLRSFLPSLLALHPRVRTVVTLHEFSIFRPYRLPWFAPFRFADALVFTNEVERGAFEARLGRRRKPTAVIPIGSNIPLGRDADRDPRGVLHFGLIMPGKGIESFLELAELLRGEGFNLSIVGATPAGAEAYLARVAERCASLDIALRHDRPDGEVADLLRAGRFAYLPFPDGASEKRGSLLAVLQNGLTTLTTTGPATPPWIAAATVAAPSAGAAAEAVRALAASPVEERPPGATFPGRSWPEIAERHLRLYRSVMV